MPQTALAEKPAASSVVTSDRGQDIKARYEALKAANEHLRARNAAEELGVTEGELLAARVGSDAIRLVDDPEAIFLALKPLGEVMALTRNESVVHERKGVYDNISFSQHGPMKNGIAVNPDIDLRMFMNSWKYCFAAIEQTRGGPRKSLQFFDKSGNALHKIYLTVKSNEAEYDALVARFTAPQQTDTIEVEPSPAKQPELADGEIDVEGLHKGWRNLKDTHDFYILLRKYKAGRTQALRLAEPEFAYAVEPSRISREVLERARDKGCEIMVFVGNRGMIQIHTGPVHKLLEHESWFNVMDPQFNLHLQEDKVAQAWVTRKPTDDGIVTAVELFDQEGELICTFFGKRKPGIPELALWREIVEELPRQAA